MFIVFMILHMISVASFCIMGMQGIFEEIIPDYKISEKGYMLGMMAFVGGWLFAPYFIWLITVATKKLKNNQR